MTLEFLDSEPGKVDNGTLVLLGGITVLGFGVGLILGTSILRRMSVQDPSRRLCVVRHARNRRVLQAARPVVLTLTSRP